jgi:hypothetical protein
MQREHGHGEAKGAADEADGLQADAADAIGQQHRGQDADDQQHVEQCGPWRPGCRARSGR